jgi:hypothetical protein
MRKRLFMLGLAVLGVAAAASARPAFADTGCWRSIVVGGTMACYAIAGNDCHDCTYKCDDGNVYEWNVCNPN